MLIVFEKDEERNGNVPKIFIQLSNEIDSKEEFIKNIIEKYFINSNMNSKYIVTFRDLPHIWTFIEKLPKNTMGKTNLHALLTGDFEGDEYKILIDEDNSGIKSYEIENLKRKVK